MRKANIPSYHALNKKQNSPNHRCKAPQLFSFSPHQHPSFASGILRQKKVLREAPQNPLNKPHRH